MVLLKKVRMRGGGTRRRMRNRMSSKEQVSRESRVREVRSSGRAGLQHPALLPLLRRIEMEKEQRKTEAQNQKRTHRVVKGGSENVNRRTLDGLTRPAAVANTVRVAAAGRVRGETARVFFWHDQRKWTKAENTLGDMQVKMEEERVCMVPVKMTDEEILRGDFFDSWGLGATRFPCELEAENGGANSQP